MKWSEIKNRSTPPSIKMALAIRGRHLRKEPNEMAYDDEILPGMLNPGEFDPKMYEEIFRNAPNVRLSDERIRCPLLERAIANSLGAATAMGSLMYRLSEAGRATLSNSIKDQLAGSLFQSFSGVKASMTKSDYRVWHDFLCQELIAMSEGLECKEGEPGWTYGNSQKVVNLIVKYLVVIASRGKEIGIRNETTEIGDAFLGVKDDLDIPVDSYILEASWNHNRRKGERQLVLPFNGERQEGGFACYKVKPWSKWGKGDYDRYSESLHEVFDCPLDWEGYAWTEVGKARKKVKI